MASPDDVGIALDSFVSKLHPRVAKFCSAMGDGATITEAQNEAGLSSREVDLVLPKLRAAISREMA